ncbi:hypothetical protein MRB53_029717 [Persea americana]|uniref:Uncharacterized protein n=1 Tax=Persea americana TaxID=3435 RepID=A0ACC2KJB2_PERAE|nr:hypothetical protein MRB53_029717 [Persea americana]
MRYNVVLIISINEKVFFAVTKFSGSVQKYKIIAGNLELKTLKNVQNSVVFALISSISFKKLQKGIGVETLWIDRNVVLLNLLVLFFWVNFGDLLCGRF